MNPLSALGSVLVLGVGSAALSLTVPAVAVPAVAAANAGHRPPATLATTFVKAYSEIVNGAQVDLFPVDVQATSDGGSIALAESSTSAGLGANWLVKLGASGVPQWEEQVGCSSPEGAPGDYAEGVSVQQANGGGYVVAGGTIDCGSGHSCPPLSGRSCALVEKLTAAGKVSWARVYRAGPRGSTINQIRPTSDGGYIAAGSYTSGQERTGALLLKLDGSGRVQWQQDIGPDGATQAYFNSVQQTSGGGYVAAGDYYIPGSGLPHTQVLVSTFGASGDLVWQDGFATPATKGAPASVSNVTSVIQTADGGYAVAGGWSNATFNSGNGAQGALLLKLDASGNLQWQQAYSGGIYCYDNGFSETCRDIGAVGYSVHQTAGGDYVLAGNGDLELSDSVPIVPWLAQADADGNLTWQHFYYQTYTTGAPLTQYFLAAAQAPGGGFLATGPTEDYATQKHELYAVMTDSAGLVASCPDLHPATPLQAINPGLTPTAPGLTPQAATTRAVTAPVAAMATSISTQQDC